MRLATFAYQGRLSPGVMIGDNIIAGGSDLQERAAGEPAEETLRHLEEEAAA